jgi:hypothetical protein
MAAAFPPPASSHVYQRHRPETTALYEVVRDDLRAEPVARLNDDPNQGFSSCSTLS